MPADPEPDPDPVPIGSATPEEAVLAWIDVLGEGDFDGGVGLLGPRSRATLPDIPDGLRTIMASSEGFGAWAFSPDRRATVVDLGALDGRQVAVVVLSGTVTQEGMTDERLQAIPTVRGADGSWRAEPFAYDWDGTPVFVAGAPTGGPVAAEVRGGAGQFHFWAEGRPVERVAGTPRPGGSSTATWDPGELPAGTPVVVAHVAGDDVSAHAITAGPAD